MFHKKLCSMLLVLVLCLNFFQCMPLETSAATPYMSGNQAKNFLAFVYNANINTISSNNLSNDRFYKMLTGGYANDPETERATAAAFLFFMDARISYMLKKVNMTAKTTSASLINYFSDKLEDEITGMVTGVFQDNVLSHVISACGDDGDQVMKLANGMKDLKDAPMDFFADVQAIVDLFRYSYGQNVESLYTYFDAAISCVSLKSTPGAYELAMSANITILKDSNALSNAVLLIPGATSWTEWIDHMDYWAEYVYNLRNKVLNGHSSSTESYLITFHSNCAEVEDISYTYYKIANNFTIPEMTRPGYVFGGWYWDQACTNQVVGSVVPDRDMHFYAKWIDHCFEITFDSCCEEVPDYTYTYDVLAGNWVEPVMERPGYTFAGWYWDKSYSQPATEFQVDRDLTFYAKWKLNYLYKVVNGGAVITDLLQYPEDNGVPVTDLVIPGMVDGYPVTGIGKDAFYNDRSLTGITLPDSVKTIEEGAFRSCIRLTKANLGAGVVEIGKNAFSTCSKLEEVVLGNQVKTIGESAFAYCFVLARCNIPESVTRIEASAFFQCEKLTKIPTPKGVEFIGGSAFFGCTGLTEMEIPDRVLAIYDYTFYGCTNLKYVTIGSGVNNIGDYAFSSCVSLESINISAANQYYTSIDGVLFDKGAEVLLQYPAGKKTAVYTVPNTVEEIVLGAFSYCNNLVEVVVPDRVGTLGDEAFAQCEKLEKVTLSDNIKQIGYDTFSNCKSLKEVKLPAKLEVLEGGAFYNNDALETITIPDTVTYFGSSVFMGCDALQSITIPAQIKFLPYGTFSSCTSLEGVVLPEGLEGIDYFAFSYCSNLKNVRLPDSVTYIDSSAFEFCESLETINIPRNTKNVGYGAFTGCTNLSRLIVHDTLESIWSGAFDGCDNISDIYYTGSAEQWNQVEIEEYNDALQQARMHYNTDIAASIPTVQCSGGKVSGTLSYDYVEQPCDVLLALFDGSDLLETIFVPCESDGVPFDFKVQVADGAPYTVKAFFWDFDSLYPYAEVLTKNVQ